jgi:hypothetical protein
MLLVLAEHAVGGLHFISYMTWLDASSCMMQLVMQMKALGQGCWALLPQSGLCAGVFALYLLAYTA